MRIDRNQALRDDEGGRCRLCGRAIELSFEHVPPRAAGNAGSAWTYGLESWLGRDRDTGRPAGRATIQQRGSGVYTLCRGCNERAGSRYIPEFLSWVAHGQGQLDRIGPHLADIDAMTRALWLTTELERVRPARFLKQVTT